MSVIIDIETGEIYNLTETLNDYLFQYEGDEDLYWDNLIEQYEIYLHGKKAIVGFMSGLVVVIDIESGIASPVNNPEYDIMNDFYGTQSGHVLVGAHSGNNYEIKLFPANGSAPITIELAEDPMDTENDFTGLGGREWIRYHSPYYIAVQGTDYIYSITGKTRYELTNTGILNESVSANVDSIESLGPRQVFECYTEEGYNDFRYNKLDDQQKVFYDSSGLLQVVSIENETISVNEYSVPIISTSTGMAFIHDTFIYDDSGNGLYTYDVGTNESVCITEEPLAGWEIVGNQILYYVYDVPRQEKFPQLV